MAQLKMQSGEVLTDLQAVQNQLEPLGVELASWPLVQADRAVELLDKEALSDLEKEELLELFDGYFNQLKVEQGYQARDLVVLHSGIPNLTEITSKFDKCHTHDDDEVRYIIDGAGVFGFVRPDGSQVALTIEPGEFINVPKDTEHWFYLTPERRIKAVRYFTSKEGWVPRYTDTEVRV